MRVLATNLCEDRCFQTQKRHLGNQSIQTPAYTEVWSSWVDRCLPETRCRLLFCIYRRLSRQGRLNMPHRPNSLYQIHYDRHRWGSRCLKTVGWTQYGIRTKVEKIPLGKAIGDELTKSVSGTAAWTTPTMLIAKNTMSKINRPSPIINRVFGRIV